MPNFTPRLNLIKPLANESFSVEHANGNADKLDAGIPLKATQAQAIAMTGDTTYMTPLRTTDVIKASNLVGPNYYNGSHKITSASGGAPIYNEDGTVTVTITAANAAVAFSFNGLGLNHADVYNRLSQNVTFGENVTMSFDLEVVSGSLTTPNIYFHAQMGYMATTPIGTLEVGNKVRVFVTRLFNRNTTGAIITHMTFNAGVYKVGKLKIEKGSIPTPWCPSPDDLIEIVNSHAAVSASTSTKGHVQQATQAQAIAMTDDTTYMTPLLTANSIGVHANNNTHVFWVGNATGTNTLSATYANITSYTQGLAISFSVATNTTLAAKLRVNSLAYVPILNSRGTAVANLRAGGVYTVRYSGTNFILQGEGGEYGNATAAQVLAPNTIGTENGLVTGTIVNRGAFNLGTGVNVPVGFYEGGMTANGNRYMSSVGDTVGMTLTFPTNFMPRIIVIRLVINPDNFFAIYDSNNSTTRTYQNGATVSTGFQNFAVGDYVNNSGFRITLTRLVGGQYTWQAYE